MECPALLPGQPAIKARAHIASERTFRTAAIGGREMTLWVNRYRVAMSALRLSKVETDQTRTGALAHTPSRAWRIFSVIIAPVAGQLAAIVPPS
jgi:hypothetical protein